MTRAEIKAGASSSALLVLRGAGLADVIARVVDVSGNILDPVQLDKELDQQVLEMCQAVKHLWVIYTADIEDGVSPACPPALLEIRTVRAEREDGTVSYLEIVREDQLRARFPSWQIDPQEGDPVAVGILGPNRAIVYPIPNYDVADGITWEGIGYIDNSLWDGATDECPLLERFHQTVEYGLTARILRKIGQGGLAASFATDYKRGKGYFESEMHNYHANATHRTDTYPASYISANNPLNL